MMDRVGEIIAAELDEARVRQIVREEILGLASERRATRRLSVPRIQHVVSDFYRVERSRMRSPERTAEVVRCRQIAMYLARETTGRSFPSLGREFERDHTTILYAWRKVKEDLEHDRGLEADLMELRHRIAA